MSIKISTSNDDLEKKEKQIVIESSLDIMKVSLIDLIDCHKGRIKLNFKGKYYNKLVDDIINNLEHKEIKKIKITSKTEPLEINSIDFKVYANLNIGESLKITGSSDYFSNWKIFKNLEFFHDFWNLELNKIKDKDFFALYDNGKFYFNLGNIVFEFKFVAQNQNSVNWENIPNRYFNLNEIKDFIQNKYSKIISDFSKKDHVVTNFLNKNNQNICLESDSEISNAKIKFKNQIDLSSDNSIVYDIEDKLNGTNIKYSIEKKHLLIACIFGKNE